MTGKQQNITVRMTLCLFIALTLPCKIYPQSNISFNHIGITDGLNDLTVNYITQDSLGLLYFGTENGLNIFDGTNFESYYALNSNRSITSNIINVVYSDSKNRIWIGNTKSINLYNRSTHTFKNYRVRLQDYGIQSIFENKKGIIWFGTYGAGLQYYDTGSDSIVEANYPLLFNSSISSITEDIWGNLWIGTEYQGLFFIDVNTNEISGFSNGIKSISGPFDFSDVRIRALCGDQKGNMLIGTYDNGLFMYNSNLKTIGRLPVLINELKSSSKITRIIPDKNNNFWIATDGDGLYIYSPSELKILRLNNPDDPDKNLSNQSIRTIFFDRDNTLWAGTYKGELNYSYHLNKNSFKHYHKGLENKNISSVFAPDNNNILVGTDGSGLYRLNLINNKFESLLKSSGVNARNILAIHTDHYSNVWIGTYDEGLLKLNRKFEVLEHFKTKPNGINNNDIRSIASDSLNLYIGTMGGGLNTLNLLSRKFKYNTIDYVTHDTGIVYNFVGPVYVDSHGSIWTGTFFGITHIQAGTGKITNISARDSIDIKSLYINCIFEDSQGYLWFGTNEGLSKLNTSVWDLDKKIKAGQKINEVYKFTNYLYNEKDALIVNSILEDNFGNLWLGTNRGLIRFGINTEKHKQFYSETGINIQLFNARAACELQDGTMFFGGNNGFIGFRPDSISDLELSAWPILTKFYINLKEINRGDVINNDTILLQHINYTNKIRLKHKARIFSIAFGATNTFLPGEIQYAFMLSNFDDDWNYPEKNNKLATYSNLDPGKYIFKLKARYSNSEWNDTIRELEIEILPPFYKTWLFRICLLIFILIVLYLIYLQRVANLKNRNLKLEKQVAIKSKQLIEEKEAKLIELERNKTLQLEKETAEKEKLRIEKDMQTAQNEKLTAELNLINEKENSIKAELSASLAQISKTNDLLQVLKNELNQIINSKEEEVRIKLQQIIQKIDSETYFKDDWHKFETHFNVIYNDFIKRIKTGYPDLTRKDLRLCSYMRMNLSGNEIAQLSNITVRGVEKSRSRLRKKLNLTSEADLNDFIINY